MRKFDSPYIADWFAISLRWLTIFALTVTLSKDSELVSLLPLFALALWNLSLSVIAGLNIRLNNHRQWAVLVDILFAILLFGLENGLAGPISWVGILPILSGAIYFEMRGGVFSALIMAIITLSFSYFITGEKALVGSGIAAIIILAIGILFGFLSNQLINSIRQMRGEQEKKEKKRHKIENERLRAVYELTATLNATLSYKRVLESALDLSVRALNPDEDEDFTDRIVSAVLLFVGNRLIVKSARRFTRADSRLVFSGDEGILGAAISEGESVTFAVNVVGSPPLNYQWKFWATAVRSYKTV